MNYNHRVDPLDIERIIRLAGKSEILQIVPVGEAKDEGEKEWQEIFPLFINALRWPESPGRFRGRGVYKGENVETTVVFTDFHNRPFFPGEVVPRKIEVKAPFREAHLSQIESFNIHFLLDYPERKKGIEYSIGREIVFRFRKGKVEKVLNEAL